MGGYGNKSTFISCDKFLCDMYGDWQSINIEEQFGSMEEFRRVREGWYREWEKNKPDQFLFNPYAFLTQIQGYSLIFNDDSRINGFLRINIKEAKEFGIPFPLVHKEWEDRMECKIPTWIDFFHQYNTAVARYDIQDNLELSNRAYVTLLQFQACHMMLEYMYHVYHPWEYRIVSSKTTVMFNTCESNVKITYNDEKLGENSYGLMYENWVLDGPYKKE